MKNIFNSASVKISKLIAAFAILIANVSVSSTCFYTAYQPDVPDTLQTRTMR